MSIGHMKLLLRKANEEEVDCGWCWLSEVQVRLSVGSKNAVIELIDFIVQLTNTSAQRKQLRREQAKKYSELKNNKKEKLTETIKWKQSDLKYNER